MRITTKGMVRKRQIWTLKFASKIFEEQIPVIVFCLQNCHQNVFQDKIILWMNFSSNHDFSEKSAFFILAHPKITLILISMPKLASGEVQMTKYQRSLRYFESKGITHDLMHHLYPSLIPDGSLSLRLRVLEAKSMNPHFTPKKPAKECF